MIDEKKLKYEIMTNLHKERFQDYKTGAKGIYYLSDDLYSLIDNLPKIGGWIPCSERLPDEKGWYLVFAKNQRPFVAYFKGKTFPLNNHYHEIVAWMPLPEPYEEVKENEN